MKMLASVLFVPALAAALCGCKQHSGASAPADTAAIADQIRQSEAQWVKDYAAHDVAKAVAHYAPDAALMPSGNKRMIGTKAITDGLKGLVGDPNFQLSFTPEKVEVAQSGDLAYSRGTYTLRVTDPKTHQPVAETGSYITTYKKQTDGSWKAVDDMVAASA
ncbi:MAG: ketosteroid isomerase-like protein [Alphaproteobacteria bacterium]|nr:ketosteroid isomerase-like protein [Alphaproteobacteria bacterium]